jgi:putative ABC transport system permease protein
MENPDDSARVAKEIDDAFANSSYETHTETEKAFQAGFAKQFGNIELMILTIGSVVFFTLLLITGNTMAIAIRERTAELAVLKAIGYSDRFVLFFVLAESLLLALVGGGVGLGLAKLAASFGNPVPNILPYFNIPASKMLVGVSLALAVGVASGVIPAVGAMRLRVVNALRRV